MDFRATVRKTLDTQKALVGGTGPLPQSTIYVKLPELPLAFVYWRKLCYPKAVLVWFPSSNRFSAADDYLLIPISLVDYGRLFSTGIFLIKNNRFLQVISALKHVYDYRFC
ncbi:MAG: hypothetical protein WKF89_09685 [Chitinophagaceae bacterium]